MFYLLQLYKMTNFCPFFIGLLSDIKGQAEDLGYVGCESELVESILFDEFGIEITDQKQLDRLTKELMKHDNLSWLENMKPMLGA